MHHILFFVKITGYRKKRPWTQFSSDISPTFGWIWKTLTTPLNSAKFSTSDRLNKTNFRYSIFSGLGFPHLGCWYMLSWDLQRNPFGVYAFHRYHRFARTLVPLGSAQDRPFLLWFCPRWKLSKFHDSRVCYPDIYEFAVDGAEIRCI